LDNDYKKYCDMLNEQFVEPFNEFYKNADEKMRKQIQPYVNNIYRRWNYSAFIENAYLTPASVNEMLNHEFNREPSLLPTVTLQEQPQFANFKFDYTSYSLQNHPIIADLLTVFELCQPIINLKNIEQVPNEVLSPMAQVVHINDSFYVLFLLNLLVELDLLIKLPSIHTENYQPKKDVSDFFDSPDIFEIIVDTTVKMAARSLNALFPIENITVFSEEYLYKSIKYVANTDDFFLTLFEFFGINPSDLPVLDAFPNNLDGVSEKFLFDLSIISGTYILGMMLDKFLFTPFGYYLRIIRPFYTRPFIFEEDVAEVLKNFELNNMSEKLGADGDGLEMAFYAPCSCFHLTDLGIEYFQVERDENNYLDIGGQSFNFSNIAPLFEFAMFSQVRTAKIPQRQMFEPEICVYSLKVQYSKDSQLWLNIDVSDTTDLHTLFAELSHYFDFNINAKYVFSLTEKESPFTGYFSPNQPQMPKSAAKHNLADLDVDDGQTIFLYIQQVLPSKKIIKYKWLLEVESIHSGKYNVAYPEVTKLCKALQEE